jgi:hypothetical protein
MVAMVVKGLQAPPNERCATCTTAPFVVPGAVAHSSVPAGLYANALGAVVGRDGVKTTPYAK